ncbi:MAG: D-lyxose/D-mannose family sugar isomerase [Treponema sp.]|jgi:D-lyxose ketol-isomerase|nr:D-lyxose/D-mannose family sugar isomerase [Treponema sp.]
MKRSEINAYINEAKDFIARMRFALPPFAYWTPEDWKSKGGEYDEIRDNQLGWDLTDFGSGDYLKIGLFLFTIRNGNLHNKNCQKTYAEKLLVVQPGQVTPYHFHKSKMEDIINRGSAGENGRLNIKLYNSVDPHTLDETSPIGVSVDGRNYTVAAGSVVSLSVGESITLHRGVFHQFWSDDSTLLLGEVSMVNDDHADNFFLEQRGRFPEIEEDEKPLHLLVGDYPKYR